MPNFENMSMILDCLVKGIQKKKKMEIIAFATNIWKRRIYFFPLLNSTEYKKSVSILWPQRKRISSFIKAD